MFTESDMWEMIGKNILTIQSDVAMCDHNSIDIKKFNKFPYIGCAYSYEEGKNNWWKDTYKGAYFYGVGGMSMRKKSFVLDCIKNKKSEHKNMPEDVFFSTCLGNSNSIKPSNKDMHEFCVETDYSSKYLDKGKSVGVHKPTLMRNKEHRNRLLSVSPIAFKLGMKKEMFKLKDDKIDLKICIFIILLVSLFGFLLIISNSFFFGNLRWSTRI